MAITTKNVSEGDRETLSDCGRFMHVSVSPQMWMRNKKHQLQCTLFSEIHSFYDICD